MKLFLIISAVIAVALARPQRGQQHGNLNEIPILKYDSEGPNPDGSYHFSYETGNGISAQEQGYLKNAGNPQTEAMVAQGSFTFTGTDGQTYSITYVADDENGFRAEGAHIPTPPPIPEAIQKALAYNAAHPEEDGGNVGAARPGGPRRFRK